MESIHYYCSSPLFDESHLLHDVFVVRRMLKCEDPLELAYFSSKIFADACYYCGIDENCCDPPEALTAQFNTVLPL